MNRDEQIGVQFRYPYGGTVTIDHAEASTRRTPLSTPKWERIRCQFDYQAPDSGEFTIAVSPTDLQRPGAYTLTASASSSIGSKPLNPPEKPRIILTSPVGDMLRYTFAHPIPSVQIEYPADINRQW